MLTLPDHFRILRKRIEPDDERAEAAKNIPAQVRDFLRNDEAIKTVYPHSRLAGSYARHTAIKDIKDVGEEEALEVIAENTRRLLGDLLWNSRDPIERP